MEGTAGFAPAMGLTSRQLCRLAPSATRTSTLKMARAVGIEPTLQEVGALPTDQLSKRVYLKWGDCGELNSD